MKFRKKPIVIEATQLQASAFDKCYPNPEHVVGVVYDPVERCAYIATLEGTMRANIGDWIITGVKGEMYPCKPDIFVATYEPAETVPVAPPAEPRLRECAQRLVTNAEWGLADALNASSKSRDIPSSARSGVKARHLAALRDALSGEQAEREPCIGNDPACPCQDGDPCHYRDTETTKAWPVPQAERPPTCRWSRADDDTDMWETTCGKAFTIIDGSPADNQMAFCCYCGRELESETGDSDAD